MPIRPDPALDGFGFSYRPVPAFEPEMVRRIDTVRAYLEDRPGAFSLVLRDRWTGAAWRDPDSSGRFLMASTVKLPMALDLLLRDRAGRIRLTAMDHMLIDDALRNSSDVAADTLWARYGGADLARRFPSYGLTGVRFTTRVNWGFMTGTVADLDRMINWMLDEPPAEVRGYLVDRLRRVGPNQRWGVWGAGPAQRPGTKNGWVIGAGWHLNTVGFAGPGERYTLAVMARGPGDYRSGAETLTQIAALLFQGRHVDFPDPRL